MRLAAETPIGAFPLIDYLVLTSESVGEGLKQLARYFRLITPACLLEFREAENPVRVIYQGRPDPFNYEFAVSLCVLHLREETENRMEVDYVSFVHRPEDPGEIERALGCPVRAEALCNGFALPPRSWGLPLRRRDPVLRGVLESHADEISARLPATDALIREVRRALASRIAKADTRIGSVARALATSARSLQRQLAAAGLSYQEVLDGTRQEAASRYLSDANLSVGEVGYLLGYSEPAAFYRAFRRWTGMTPQAFRGRGRAHSQP